MSIEQNIKFSPEAIKALGLSQKLLLATAQAIRKNPSLDGINKRVVIGYFEGGQFHYRGFKKPWQARLWKRFKFPGSTRETETLTYSFPDPRVIHIY